MVFYSPGSYLLKPISILRLIKKFMLMAYRSCRGRRSRIEWLWFVCLC